MSDDESTGDVIPFKDSERIKNGDNGLQEQSDLSDEESEEEESDDVYVKMDTVLYRLNG
jgi:hypothetical protein